MPYPHVRDRRRLHHRDTHQRAVASAGHSFEGSVSYASAPEKAEWGHLRGVTSADTAAIEMEAVAALSKRCRDRSIT